MLVKGPTDPIHATEMQSSANADSRQIAALTDTEQFIGESSHSSNIPSKFLCGSF